MDYNYDNDSHFQILISLQVLWCIMKNNYFIKRIFLFFLLIFPVVLYSSCSESKTDSNKFSIVCTAFSQYDFVKEIIGEKIDLFEISYLFENGADVHSFENDVGFNVKIKIMNSDVCEEYLVKHKNGAKEII